MVAQLCEYTKNHWIVHYKQVTFMVCELCLSKAVLWKSQSVNKYLLIIFFVFDMGLMSLMPASTR